MHDLTRVAKLAALAALTLLAGYGAWNAAGDAVSALAQEPAPAYDGLHVQMHDLIDAMMGEGASERMHEAMPASEEMLEQCTAMMAMMRSMMGDGDGMMPGGMMGR